MKQLTVSRRRLLPRIALCAFLGVAAFFLWAEHRAHLLGVLPYALLLLCPLVHILGHGRHGAHDGHAGHDQRRDPTRDERPLGDER